MNTTLVAVGVTIVLMLALFGLHQFLTGLERRVKNLEQEQKPPELPPGLEEAYNRRYKHDALAAAEHGTALLMDAQDLIYALQKRIDQANSHLVYFNRSRYERGQDGQPEHKKEA